ncbi:MAG: hypothetical protein ABI134_21640, partial [Byssovorax sp.]
ADATSATPLPTIVTTAPATVELAPASTLPAAIAPPDTADSQRPAARPTTTKGAKARPLATSTPAVDVEPTPPTPTSVTPIKPTSPPAAAPPAHSSPLLGDDAFQRDLSRMH